MDINEDPKTWLSGLKTLPTSLESHTGWLMSLALRTWKEHEKIGVIKWHYIGDGCLAILYLPLDKKTYRIEIKEVQNGKS